MSANLLARKLRLGSMIGCVVAATAATAGLFPTLPVKAADPTVTAAYASTIGGPGHATMYASGMEIEPSTAPNAGDIIIADTGNNQVADYTTAGVQVWRVGTEGTGASATNIQFEQPRDVGVDSAGNVYVADNGNGRVMKLSPTGAYITKWNSEVTGNGAPIGITVSNTTANLPNLPAGERVYVSDGTKSAITIWNTNGTPVTPTAAATITDTTGDCGAAGTKALFKLNRMRDAAADASGNVYVANYENNNVLEFSWSGSAWNCVNAFGTKGTQSSTTAVCSGNGNSAFKNPYGVAIATDPTLNGGAGGEAIYIADSNDDCIQEFTPAGTFITEFGSPGTDAQDGTFFQLRRVAVDASGNVWGADLWGNRIVEYTRSPGAYTYSETLPNPIVAPGGSSTSVFNQVRGISFDASGDIVAMDTVNQRVAVFSPTGTLINFCGQRGFTDTGDFNWPRGVAVDPATGNYWIADTKQSDIQILPPITSPAMSGCGAGTYVAQTLGTALGQVDYPDSIAIAGGYAWVADTKNNRIESWNVASKAAVAAYGSLGSASGQFKTPTGIAVDPTTGNVFVADSGNNRVVELAVSAGHVTGSPIATFTSSFVQPYGVASSNGLLAVADRGNNRVVVLNENDGTVATIINGSDAPLDAGGQQALFHPENVAFAPNGNLEIADTYNDRILTYTLTTGGGGGGTGPLVAPTYASTLVGTGQASMYPVDVTNDSQYYFVLDAGNFRIIAVNRTTDAIDCQEGGLQGNLLGQMGDARAIDYDSANGEIYLADTPNNRIEVFSFSPSACATNSPTAFTAITQFGTKGAGAAQFNQAYGVAVDPVNSWLYAVDGAGRVEKFSISGNTYTYITSFGQGSLNQPRQVTVAPNSDVFVMNARNHTCDIYTSAGALIKQFGSQGKNNGQFTDDPRGVAVSADGTLAFITDSGGKRIEVFNLVQSGGHYTSASGTFAYTIPSAVSGPGQFVGPRGLTVTSDNHLLLTDEWGFNLHEMTFTATSATPTVNTTPVAPPVPGVNSPRGVHVAANGQIYIQDYWNQRVEYMNPDGTGAVSFGFRGNVSQSGAINFAWDFAIQPDTGDIFVANRENNQVATFTPTGTPMSLIIGKAGTANGLFSFPQGIAFAPDGTLLVDDSGNDRIQRFSISAGDTSAAWVATYGQKGTGSTAPAGDLNNPTGISVAPDGTIWVADTLNNRIQSMSPAGVWKVITKTTGTGTQLGFKIPWGVTVAPDGSIWVSDIGNNRIVSMSTTGSVNFSANESGSPDGTGGGHSEVSMGIPSVQADSVIYPYEIAFSNGPGPYNVYLTDIWNNRVLVLTTHNS